MAQQNAFGLTSLYDPSIAVDQAALERQMALAQALRQQSMTPVDVSGRQVGGVGYKVSPLEGLAKALQAYQANKADETNDQSRLSLMQKTAAAMGPMMAGMFGDASQAPAPVSDPNGGRPAGVSAEAMTGGGFPQPPVASSPQPAGETQGAKIKRAAMAAMLSGNTDLANKLIGNLLEMTPDQKNMIAKGIDPVRLGAAEVGKAEKEARAPTRLGNAAYADPAGQIHGLPGNVPGAINVQDAQAPGGWRSVPQAGALPNVKAAATAETLGKNPGRDAQGNPLPFDDSSRVPPAVQGQRDDQRRQILEAELAQEKDPRNRAAIQTELNALRGGTATIPQRGGVYAEPPMGAAAGAEAGAKNRQAVMKEDYTALSNQNSNAQTVISRLQTIKTLGPQAITGAESERRDFFNGLLSLAGLQSAKDAKTAGDLIDKNAAQIALAIGAGSQGTDALRALALSANPGRHMTVEAMQKAADSLIAPLQMTQAKTQLLTPHFTKDDAATYLTQKQAFEKAADPRIWELHNLPQKDQKAYVNSLRPDDAKALLEKRRALMQLGAFQ